MLVTVKNVRKYLGCDVERMVDVHFLTCKDDEGINTVRVMETEHKTCHTRLVHYFRIAEGDTETRKFRRGSSHVISGKTMTIMKHVRDEDVLMSTIPNKEGIDDYARLIPTIVHEYDLVHVTREERHSYPLRQQHLDEYLCWGFELAYDKSRENFVNEGTGMNLEAYCKMQDAIHTDELHVNMYWLLDALEGKELRISYDKK